MCTFVETIQKVYKYSLINLPKIQKRTPSLVYLPLFIILSRKQPQNYEQAHFKS